MYDINRSSALPDCKFFKQTLRKAQTFNDCYMTRIIGDDTTIQFWNHNWGQGLSYTVFTELYKEARDQNISYQQVLQAHNIVDLLYNGTSDVFRRELVQLQDPLAMQSFNSVVQDDVLWNLTSSETLYVRSAYQGITNEPMVTSAIHRIWKMKFPPRIQIFEWLVYYKKIIIAENLQRRCWNMLSMCVDHIVNQ